MVGVGAPCPSHGQGGVVGVPCSDPVQRWGEGCCSGPNWGTALSLHPVDRQTLVKIVLFPILRMGAVNMHKQVFFGILQHYLIE